MERKEDASLVGRAINIKGKKYVLVSDRVIYFNNEYHNGAITTKKLSSDDTSESLGRVEFIAKVIPDLNKPERYFTGHSQAVWGEGYINKTSAMENAETSAVGRALAMMGIGVIDSIASVDELNKTTNPAYKNFGSKFTQKKIRELEDISEEENVGD